MTAPGPEPARAATLRSGEVDADLVLDGAHPHGYLLVTSPQGSATGATGAVTGPHTGPPDVRRWRTEPALLPGAVLQLHPRTVLSCARGATGTVVLLGHPVDVGAGITDGTRIAARLCGTWDLQGEQALVREAAVLGGRWTLLAARAEGAGPFPGPASDVRGPLLVVPDTHASQPVFHAVGDGRFALGSTPALVAAALGLPVDQDAVDLLAQLRSRRPRRVTYLPGLRTAYRGLTPLVPNCLLRVDLARGPQVRTERFWPWQERREDPDVDAVLARFRERLTAHATLLAGLGRPAVSLTAGLDSRVSAAAARTALTGGGGLAFTYVNPPDARRSAAALADVTGASVVAAQLGLPHRVLRWRHPPEGGTFDVLHRRTYGPVLPSRGAAHAMWADLPADLVQLQSNGGETGTTFLRHRTSEPLSPLRLARMMMNTRAGLEDLAEQMYGGYLEATSLTPDRLLGHDHHDLFYWEQRMGRWGWQKFTDGDLGHRVLLPFNDRVLLETMLSLPYPLREAKVLFHRLLEQVPAAQLPRRRAPSSTSASTSTSTSTSTWSRTPSTGELAERAARSVSGLLPGAVGRRVGAGVGRRVARAAQERAGRATHERLSWPRGYAVLPADDAGEELAVPSSWSALPLPGRPVVLRHHPALPVALAHGERGWVLALGEPVALGPDALCPGAQDHAGPAPVAERLLTLLTGRGPGASRSAAARLAAARTAAAGLAGSWLVVLGTPWSATVLTDPLVSLGAHPGAAGVGLVSHPSLLRRPWEPVRWGLAGDQAAVVDGPLGDAPLRRVPLTAVADLPAAAAALSTAGCTRQDRLHRHAELLVRRGQPWLALAADRRSHQLIGLIQPTVHDLTRPRSLTWWDRTASSRAAEAAVVASARAVLAGLPHRVVGLHEDVDGSDLEPGRTARAAAREALATTWGDAATGVPLGDALDQVLPTGAVLWLGSAPGPATASRPQVLDLVQGVRPVALPFSDRLLPLLPR